MTQDAPLTRQDILSALRVANIQEGDVILVHNNIDLLRHLPGRPKRKEAMAILLDCFLEVLGPSGTLVVPAFNYDFCRGMPYDHKATPSQVGVFSNYVLKAPRALRSLHPIFSMAAVGPRAAELCEGVSKSAFGPESIFDRLYRANARVVFFNADFQTITFVHYVEQAVGVSYRYIKEFSGLVTIDGKTYEDTFTYLVRPLDDSVITELGRLYRRLMDRGLMIRVPLHEGFVLQVPAVDMVEETRRALLEDPYFLLAHPPEQTAAKQSGRAASAPPSPLRS